MLLYIDVMSSEEHKSPGQLVTALLAERGWTKRTLAIISGVDESIISKTTSIASARHNNPAGASWFEIISSRALVPSPLDTV